MRSSLMVGRDDYELNPGDHRCLQTGRRSRGHGPSQHQRSQQVPLLTRIVRSWGELVTSETFHNSHNPPHESVGTGGQPSWAMGDRWIIWRCEPLDENFLMNVLLSPSFHLDSVVISGKGIHHQTQMATVICPKERTQKWHKNSRKSPTRN